LNPWVKDISSGKNPGIPSLLDWPEASDESDSEVSPLQIEGAAVSTASGNDDYLSQVSLEIPGFAGFGRCLDTVCECVHMCVCTHTQVCICFCLFVALNSVVEVCKDSAQLL